MYYDVIANLSVFSNFFYSGRVNKNQAGFAHPCVDKTLILLSTGGVVLMPAKNKHIAIARLRRVPWVTFAGMNLRFQSK